MVTAAIAGSLSSTSDNASTMFCSLVQKTARIHLNGNACRLLNRSSNR